MKFTILVDPSLVIITTYLVFLIHDKKRKNYKKKKKEAHRPYPSREYQTLYTDFFSEGLIFVYQQPHHRIDV